MRLRAGVVVIVSVVIIVLAQQSDAVDVELDWKEESVGQYSYSNPRQVNLGDRLVLICSPGSFSNAFYFAGEDAFNNCDGSLSTKESTPQIFGRCTEPANGTERTLQLPIEKPAFEENEIFSVASFSAGGDLVQAFSDSTTGGQCESNNLKLTLMINPNNPGTGGLSGSLGTEEIIAIAVSCSAFVVIILLIIIIILSVYHCQRAKTVSLERGNTVVPVSNGYKVTEEKITKEKVKDSQEIIASSEEPKKSPEKHTEVKTSRDKPGVKKGTSEPRRSPPHIPNGKNSTDSARNNNSTDRQRNGSNSFNMKKNSSYNNKRIDSTSANNSRTTGSANGTGNATNRSVDGANPQNRRNSNALQKNNPGHQNSPHKAPQSERARPARQAPGKPTSKPSGVTVDSKNTSVGFRK